MRGSKFVSNREARTLLGHDDLFYFGNAIGETGSIPGNTFVTSVDVIGARDHQRGPFDLAGIDDVYDFNRDRLVSSIDVIIARDHQSGALTSLPLISVPAASRSAATVAMPAAADAVWQEHDPAGLPSKRSVECWATSISTACSIAAIWSWCFSAASTM